jgi:hypothetical protein
VPGFFGELVKDMTGVGMRDVKDPASTGTRRHLLRGTPGCCAQYSIAAAIRL